MYHMSHWPSVKRIFILSISTSGVNISLSSVDLTDSTASGSMKELFSRELYLLVILRTYRLISSAIACASFWFLSRENWILSPSMTEAINCTYVAWLELHPYAPQVDTVVIAPPYLLILALARQLAPLKECSLHKTNASLLRPWHAITITEYVTMPRRG